MNKKRVGLRFLNRFLYNGRIDPENKYSVKRNAAESKEMQAKDLIRENGEMIGIANCYEDAAKYWVAAKEKEKAADDFLEAAKYWKNLAFKAKNMRGVAGVDYARPYNDYSERCVKNAHRLVKVSSKRWHGLEGKSDAIITIGGIVLGLFFLSPNLTGNVVGNLTSSSSNIVGSVFLIVGLIAGFFWIRRK